MKKLLSSIVFALIGAALAVYAGLKVERSVASSGWPTVEGQVTSSEVETVRTRRGGAAYVPHVAYRYDVDGKTYSSDVVAFHAIDDPAGVRMRYRNGSKVLVHYAPSAPGLACLEPSHPGWRDLVMLIVGLGFVGGSAVTLRRDLKGAPKQKGAART